MLSLHSLLNLTKDSLLCTIIVYCMLRHTILYSRALRQSATHLNLTQSPLPPMGWVLGLAT